MPIIFHYEQSDKQISSNLLDPSSISRQSQILVFFLIKEMYEIMGRILNITCIFNFLYTKFLWLPCVILWSKEPCESSHYRFTFHGLHPTWLGIIVLFYKALQHIEY